MYSMKIQATSSEIFQVKASTVELIKPLLQFRKQGLTDNENECVKHIKNNKRVKYIFFKNERVNDKHIKNNKNVKLINKTTNVLNT